MVGGSRRVEGGSPNKVRAVGRCEAQQVSLVIRDSSVSEDVPLLWLGADSLPQWQEDVHKR